MKSRNFGEELIEFGNRLKQLRKLRKLKLLDLEVLSGVNDSDISRYERGKENIEFYTIYKLARALDVEIMHLYDYNGPLPDNTNFQGVASFTHKKKVTKKRKR